VKGVTHTNFIFNFLQKNRIWERRHFNNLTLKELNEIQIVCVTRERKGHPFTVIYRHIHMTHSGHFLSAVTHSDILIREILRRHLFNGCWENKSKAAGAICCGLPEWKEELAIVVPWA
jgi:hypothetical protein